MNKEFTMGDAFILADVITRAKALEGSEKMTVDISMIDMEGVQEVIRMLHSSNFATYTSSGQLTIQRKVKTI